MKRYLMQWMWLTIVGLVLFTHDACAADAPMLRIEAGVHTGPIRRLAVDPSEKWLVTTSDDKTARVWDLKTRRLLSILRVPIQHGDTGKLYGVAIAPSGKEVAVGGSTGGDAWGHRIYLFNLESGALSGTIDARAGHVRHLAWSNDGRFLIASYAGEDGMRVFDRSGKQRFEERFSGPSYGAAVSAGGKIAVPAFDGKVHFYEVTGEGVRPAGPFDLPQKDPLSASFSPDGKLLAVGYLASGTNGNVRVDVLEVASGRAVRNFQFSDIRQGNLKNVVWRADGSAIYAAGSGYHGSADFIAKRIAWPSGSISEIRTGSDTTTDMAPLSDGSIVFSTFEPALGILKDDRVTSRQGSPVFDLRGAANFRIDAQGMLVSWYSREKSAPVSFDAKNRTWHTDTASEVKPARTSSSRFQTARWEDSFTPQLNGRAIPLAPGEVSRAAAVLPDDSAMLLATSWNLRKLDQAGTEIWRLPAATEIKAVNISADSKTAVIALSDGTVRWLDTSDGRTLMSLFALSDGRWIMWTDKGHYDTSIGAETLIGWHVNRPDNIKVDFFPVSHFRDRFYRPDVIDKVLPLHSAEKALAQANEELSHQVKQAHDDEVHQVTQPLLNAAAPPSPQQGLPPVLTLASSQVIQSDAPTMSIDFSLFTHTPAPVSSWQVKIDGRPVDPISLAAPAKADGRTLGRLTLPRPEKNAVVQLFAANSFGVSEPLTVQSIAGAALASSPGIDKQPALYVLAVGVSKYANTQYDLLFPAKDASDFVNVMKQQEGLVYKSVTARLLTDEAATRKSVNDGLTWLLRNTSASDVGVLFIAGHGITDIGNTYRFLPHDADISLPRRSMVSEAQIREALVKIRGKAIFFIDTCYSGNAVGRFTKHDITLIANKLSSPDSGVLVFSSSDGRQESLENVRWNNGAFTKELVIGLKGKADVRRDGVVTHKDLDYYVSSEVRKLTSGRQTPVTTMPFSIPDFILTKAVE